MVIFFKFFVIKKKNFWVQLLGFLYFVKQSNFVAFCAYPGENYYYL